jgi:hypothetical protein
MFMFEQLDSRSDLLKIKVPKTHLYLVTHTWNSIYFNTYLTTLAQKYKDIFSYHVHTAGLLISGTGRLRATGRRGRAGTMSWGRANGRSSSKLPSGQNTSGDRGAGGNGGGMAFQPAPHVAATVIQAAHHSNTSGGHPHANLKGFGVLLRHRRARCSLNLNNIFSCKSEGWV